MTHPRLIKISDEKYSYRRHFENTTFEVSAARVSAIYRKHFPHDSERDENNVLLAMDVETSTANKATMSALATL